MWASLLILCTFVYFIHSWKGCNSFMAEIVQNAKKRWITVLHIWSSYIMLFCPWFIHSVLNQNMISFQRQSFSITCYITNWLTHSLIHTLIHLLNPSHYFLSNFKTNKDRHFKFDALDLHIGKNIYRLIDLKGLSVKCNKFEVSIFISFEII